jgi:hypothetical protein
MNIPFAFAVINGDDKDHENIILQFDHPEMCGQNYKDVIPLFNAPIVKPYNWKVIGDNTNFTIIGQDEENNIYYWKDQKWNLL